MVPRTFRNLASQSGWAGQAGAAPLEVELGPEGDRFLVVLP